MQREDKLEADLGCVKFVLKLFITKAIFLATEKFCRAKLICKLGSGSLSAAIVGCAPGFQVQSQQQTSKEAEYFFL